MYRLGIDVGTGGSRALLVDASGDIADGVALAVDGEPSEVGLMLEVAPTSEVQIMPAIAGGAR